MSDMKNQETANEGYELKLRVEPSRAGIPTLKFIEGSQQFYIHSRYNPEAEAEKWAVSFYEEGKKLFILIGIGLGYQAKALLSKMKENERLLLVEPVKEIFDMAVQDGNINQILKDERVIFCCTDNNMASRQVFLDVLRGGLITDYKLYISPVYLRIFTHQTNEAVKIFEDIIRFEQININTVKFFAAQWQNNYLRNMFIAAKSCPYLLFKQRFSCPVVIVSAGPSLTSELPFLKSLYNKAVIIAAGSAVTTLKKNGIKPHIIVSIDGGMQNYRHFKQLDYDDVPLFYSPEIHYKILEEYKGPKVVFQFYHKDLSNWYNELLGFETGTVVAGLSVANVALDIALQVSNGPVCFIGQDLGYTDGYSHAEGNINRKSLEEFKEKGRELIEIEANDGSKLWTDYVYLDMKNWFENYLICNKDRQVYNATLKGAKIKGMIPIKFADFIENYCKAESDIAGQIKEILSEHHFCRDAELKENVLEIVYRLEHLKMLTLNGKKTAAKLLEAVESREIKKIEKLLKKMEKIDEELKEIEDKDIFLFFIRQPLLIKFNYSYIPEKIEDDKFIAKENYFFYETLYNMTENVLRILSDQINGVVK
ncbi:6-hydroxymethylpterin diphosphokinase MptE-like protein [Thermosyntropha sp.]|uniref:motility associated factor glycosyltransferase family protein n=1 Tax=Thermosyntropha sp. TaxID=2740820 RepID=UPI0025FAD3B8|nr:6-hydroxymethylpterin diphosphokinase MptE-like protein [Thermosyntropha sp.]MBO8159606.1 motility associated factor glycosyltransferase family protein [Thermosyntropha sp.]